MLFNRMILLILIITTGILASCYGGNVSYALFYMSLSIPVVSFLYTFYVYIRFRIYQEIDQRTVVKGDLTPYSFTIANEDYITFRSVKVNFFHDRSTITNVASIKEYCLLPNASEKMETKVRCNYRGEYYIGANTVEIMDYFYLFRVTYPILSKLKITVLPRVITLHNLSIAPSQKDNKKYNWALNQNKELLDIDTQKYLPGASIRQIHWKVTAKRNELFTRKYTSNPRMEIRIIIDLQPVSRDDMTTTIVEDQILESALAIANYYTNINQMVSVTYGQNEVLTLQVRSKNEFHMFYELCTRLHFSSNIPVHHIIENSYNHTNGCNFYIVLTHHLTVASFQSIQQIAHTENEIAVLLFTDEIDSEEEDITENLNTYHVPVKRINRQDEIGEVLSA